MYIVKYSDNIVTRVFCLPKELANTCERLLCCHNQYYKKNCKVVGISQEV